VQVRGAEFGRHEEELLRHLERGGGAIAAVGALEGLCDHGRGIGV